MSLLSIVQDACRRIGIAAPTAVVSSSDPQIVQLLALVNVEGKKLATCTSVGLSYDWQSLQTEATFTSVALELQGVMTTIAPGFKYIIGDTVWDRTTRLKAYGSITPQDWQNNKAWFLNGPYPAYRVRGGQLLFNPIPAAGHSYYFEYQSSYWCTDATGVTLKAAFTADTDIARLDEDLISDGLVWRWKQAKGLDYAEDFNAYQIAVTNAVARDVDRPVLNQACLDPLSGVVVPIGNWRLP